MTIRYFDDIHSIRKELRRIEAESRKDLNSFSTIKRILLNASNIKLQAADEITVRQTYKNDKPEKEPKTEKVQKSALANLSKIAHERKERQEIAEHILFTLKNNFGTEDSAVLKKLTELSQQLVNETTKLAVGADAVLNEHGTKLAPRDFKKDVNDIASTLAGELDIKTSSIDVKYYVGVDKVNESEGVTDRIYYMGYMSVKNLKGPDTVRDLYVVATRRMGERGTHNDFIRTFNSFISPASLLKNNIGTEYTNSSRAAEIVMRSLKLDKFIDTLHPSQIPVKKEQLKLKNNNIARQVVDEKAGVVKLYLNDSIKTREEADKALQDIFVEVRNIVKSLHPRNRNPVKASVPKLSNVTYRTPKGKETKKQQYVFRITFSKPEHGEALELPRDKVEQFTKALDISNPEAAKEFNRLLKNFVRV